MHTQSQALWETFQNVRPGKGRTCATVMCLIRYCSAVFHNAGLPTSPKSFLFSWKAACSTRRVARLPSTWHSCHAKLDILCKSEHEIVFSRLQSFCEQDAVDAFICMWTPVCLFVWYLQLIVAGAILRALYSYRSQHLWWELVLAISNHSFKNCVKYSHTLIHHNFCACCDFKKLHMLGYWKCIKFEAGLYSV